MKEKGLFIVERNEFTSGRKQSTLKEWETYSVMGDADYYVIENANWEMQTLFVPGVSEKSKTAT